MTKKAEIDEFLSQKRFAVIGVSRKKTKFGRMVYSDLKKKGYQLFPINPQAETIEGDPCYPNLDSLPQPVDGAIFVVPPVETETMVQEAASHNIPRIWMQQGSESEEAIRFCHEKGISVIHGECILMFAEPAGFIHRLHRLLWKWMGKLPK